MHTHPSGYKGLSGFHKYWGKKPVESWRFLIERFTNEQEIVLDPFLGSGLIAKECTDLGRRFVGFDINPISIELTKLYLDLPDYRELKSALENISRNVKEEIDSLYALPDGRIVSHILWEEDEICHAWMKIRNRRVELSLTEDEICAFKNAKHYSPTRVREINLFDNSRINSSCDCSLNDLFSPRALLAIDLLKREIENHQGRMRRALSLMLSASLGQMSRMVFAVSKRGKVSGKITDRIEVGSWVIGYWRPKQHFEINAWNCFENKAQKLLKAIPGPDLFRSDVDLSDNLGSVFDGTGDVYLGVGDAERLLDEIPPNSVKVILTDPPHGDRIPYLELSEMWNSVIGLEVNYEDELIISDAKGRGKGADEYNEKLSRIFAKCHKVLSDDGLMAVMFNARSKNHWQSLENLKPPTGFRFLGCYRMKYSAGSVVQDSRSGGLKTDFVLLYSNGDGYNVSNMVQSRLHSFEEWTTSHPTQAAS